MADVLYTELIIACESCGEVKKFTVTNQSDADGLFQDYQCPNGCGRQLYSFITLGTLSMNAPIEENRPAEKIQQ